MVQHMGDHSHESGTKIEKREVRGGQCGIDGSSAVKGPAHDASMATASISGAGTTSVVSGSRRRISDTYLDDRAYEFKNQYMRCAN
jgi:hypothetical protein